jgi:hypothetical protein
MPGDHGPRVQRSGPPPSTAARAEPRHGEAVCRLSLPHPRRGLDFPARARRKLVESIRLHPRTLLARKTWCLLLAWLPLPWLPTRLRRPAVMLLLRSYGRCSAIWRPAVRALRSRLPARAEAELKRPLGGTAGPQPVGHAGGVLRIRPTAKNT